MKMYTKAWVIQLKKYFYKEIFQKYSGNPSSAGVVLYSGVMTQTVQVC